MTQTAPNPDIENYWSDFLGYRFSCLARGLVADARPETMEEAIQVLRDYAALSNKKECISFCMDVVFHDLYLLSHVFGINFEQKAKEVARDMRGSDLPER